MVAPVSMSPTKSNLGKDSEYVKSVLVGPCVVGVDRKSIEFALAMPHAAAANEVVNSILRSFVIVPFYLYFPSDRESSGLVLPPSHLVTYNRILTEKTVGCNRYIESGRRNYAKEYQYRVQNKKRPSRAA